MNLKKFIATLKGDHPGRIFWLNLCAHWNEGCLKIDTIKEVFNSACIEIDKYSWTTKEDGSEWAYITINNQTTYHLDKKNPSTVINSIQKVPPVQWNIIKEISTLINENGFWTFYVTFQANGHEEILDEIGPKKGSLEGTTEDQIKDELLARLQDSSNNSGHTTDRLWSAMKENTMLRTAADRFWASIQMDNRSKNPDDLALQLGLTNFVAGNWVIEISFDAADVMKLLKANGKDLKRPSALCVNDTTAPRFRAHTLSELSQNNSTPGSISYNWHGTTIDLKQWDDKNTAEPMDGLPELMCPALPWRDSKIKPTIKIIGKIIGNKDVPDNMAYANYLERIFACATAKESLLLIEMGA